MLERMFARQTRELRDSQKMELARATGQIQAEFRKQLSSVLEDVKRVAGKVDQQHERIQEMEQAHKDVVQRLRVLEAGGSTRASSSFGDAETKLGIIVGGWKPLTRKHEVLQQVELLVEKLGCKDQLDVEWFCTGVRRGYALSQGKQRVGESFEQARQRLLEVIASIQAAKVPPEPEGETPFIWAGLQRPKADRDKSSHLGKLRKLFHQEAPHLITALDYEYRTGTAQEVVASVGLPVPSGRSTIAGKLLGSWVDVKAVAGLMKLGEDKVQALLEGVYGK